VNNNRALLIWFLCLGIFFLQCSQAMAHDLQDLQVSLSDEEAISAFLAERDGEPLWVKRKKLNSEAQDLMTVLQQSWMNGLNPKNYHIDEIIDLIGSEDMTSRAKGNHTQILEMLITDAYIRYRRDISGMRISLEDMNLRQGDWKQRISVDEALLDLKEHYKNIAEFLLESEPQGRTYQTLKTELVRLYEKAGNKDIRPIYFDKILHPGREDDAIPILRSHFNLPPMPEDEKLTYDPKLVEAVKNFQKGNGLRSDGIIGKRTESALNKIRGENIRQIIVNLERLRWIEEKKPKSFIVVNLPSAMLWAIENGRVIHEMPVIIGRKDRPTESFVAQINGVRFNPKWTVPSTIKKEDIVPELVENNSYLVDKGMEIFQKSEDGDITIDPSSVDWSNLSPEELGNYTMVQTSGDHNPLGRIRVLMPNEYNIYLHDTNHPGLFSRSNRAQSSGCIRMMYPEKVADFIMKQNKGWRSEDMIDILKAGEATDKFIQDTIPVFLLYNTVWLGDKNQIIYGMDIYDHDKKLWQLLEKLDGFSNLHHNEIIAEKSVNKL